MDFCYAQTANWRVKLSQKLNPAGATGNPVAMGHAHCFWSGGIFFFMDRCASAQAAQATICQWHVLVNCRDSSGEMLTTVKLVFCDGLQSPNGRNRLAKALPTTASMGACSQKSFAADTKISGRNVGYRRCLCWTTYPSQTTQAYSYHLP